MNNTDKLALIIDNNWEKVKSEIHHTWRKLSEKELDAIHNFHELVQKLMEAYEITEEEVYDKISNFIQKTHLKPNLTHMQAMKRFFYKKIVTIKNKLRKAQALDYFQKTVDELPFTITHCVKKNPWKSIGVGVLSAIVIKKIFTSTNNHSKS